MLNCVIDSIVPLVALLLLGRITYQVYLYVMSLNVVGKPNEWVVLINNGQMKQAGIGLNVIRGPFDQVAIFPSRVVRQDIKAQQIDSEYQGIEVGALIVWTINRENDGPMKAYRNLGGDLSSDTPTTANNLISNMASAVIRNQIANKTMMEIMADRETLKELIVKELMPVTQGWGIWLETVEITDVKILSSSLFKNMQSEFREKQNFEATQKTLEVDQEINIDRAAKNQTLKLRNEDTNKTKCLQ